jgi:hypothetical protein
MRGPELLGFLHILLGDGLAEVFPEPHLEAKEHGAIESTPSALHVGVDLLGSRWILRPMASLVTVGV